MEQRIANVVQATGLDPDVILAVITSIMELISQLQQSCKTPPSAEDAMRAHSGVVGVYVMHTALRRNGIRPLSREGRALKRALQSEAAKMQADDWARLMLIQ